MSEFIGRTKELHTLRGLYDKKIASLVVVKGRRRIGKSRLIEEFGKNQELYTFTGLPPSKKVTSKDQIKIFINQLKKYFNKVPKTYDWWEQLSFLAKKTQRGRVIILLDEISWMGSKSSDFLGILKTLWDTEFKKNPKLILILCGSVSFWIEKNILSDTGFMGRISVIMTLKELPLKDCDLFWRNQRYSLSPYEKFKILSITGGIPRYLEELKPNLSAEENIRQLCFEESGILFNEFDQIFSDLFSKRSDTYKKIVMYLADHKSDRNEIAKQLDMEVGGHVSEYLDNLVKAGFICRDYSWRIQNGKTSKLSRFRLSDNYLRFYLNYILPNKNKIEAGAFEERSISTLPAWNTIMGFQFENLVLNNRGIIQRLLGIHAEEILAEGSYFQRKSVKQSGCQIDYLIETKFNSLYVCEIRFSRYEIKTHVISEVKEKIDRLKIPKNFSYRTVLIHVNGVEEKIEDSDYFAKIISFDELLK